MSNKLDSCVCHIEAAAPLRPERRGGALDTEDLVSPFLLVAFHRDRHNSLFSRTQQPVFNQPLPWATKIGPGKLGGSGRCGVAPPDGVARGEHRDPVVPGNESMLVGTEGKQTLKRLLLWAQNPPRSRVGFLRPRRRPRALQAALHHSGPALQRRRPRPQSSSSHSKSEGT